METNGCAEFSIIFFLLVCSCSGQAPPTQSGLDVSTFIYQTFNTWPEASASIKPPTSDASVEFNTVNPIADHSTSHEVPEIPDYDVLVRDIFYNDSAVINCSNGDLGLGECTHFYLCNENRTIITDGSARTLITFRMFDVCPLLKPCCTLKKDESMEIIKSQRKPEPPTACGLRNRNGLQVVITDQPPYQAQEGELPWTVAILERNDSAKSKEDSPFLCGGSLIHSKMVMTAAHCLTTKTSSNIFIRAGDWDSLSQHEYFQHQDRDVQEIIKHDDFNPLNGFNDIALLLLKIPVQIAENVNTVCLPPPNVEFTDSRCFASGWGALTWKERHFLSIMKRVELPVVARDVCLQRLRTTRLGTHFQLHESFICAGGENDIDTCRGDGGSPLACRVHQSGEQYYQVGIVSWGVECNMPGLPGVYVNVPHFRNWIDKQMARKGLSTSSYVAEATRRIDYRDPF